MTTVEYEWSLEDVPDGNYQAGGTAPTQEDAEREAGHYLHQYANDDTGMCVKVYRVTREFIGGMARLPDGGTA